MGDKDEINGNSVNSLGSSHGLNIPGSGNNVMEGGNRDEMNKKVISRAVQHSLRRNVKGKPVDGSDFSDGCDEDL
jgi:hypothetical protein